MTGVSARQKKTYSSERANLGEQELRRRFGNGDIPKFTGNDCQEAALAKKGSKLKGRGESSEEKTKEQSQIMQGPEGAHPRSKGGGGSKGRAKWKTLGSRKSRKGGARI